MVKVIKGLTEKAIPQKKPWFYYIEEQCTLISDTIPSPAEILFGRKMRSNLTILPSQLMNNQIVHIREEIAKKEGKILCEEDNSTELELEPRQALGTRILRPRSGVQELSLNHSRNHIHL